jgi:D-aspartate ligase
VRRTDLDLDRSVPVLVAKVGRYPLHPGGIGAIRTLGRLGIPVYAVTEDRYTPAAVSRHLHDRFVWPTTGQEDPAALVDGLLMLGRRIGRRSVLLPTDDEAAVLVAANASTLGAEFHLPAVPPHLPATLADKHGLHGLCHASGVPAPASARPESVDELITFAAAIGYPVVLKNAGPWSRLRRPAVGATTVVADEGALLALTGGWAAMPAVLVQEYLSGDGAEDWMVAIYCDRRSEPRLVFTGRKLRAWPPHAGVATRAYAMPNPALAGMTAAMCASIGYCGIADLDWRLDPATGDYKLLDFNPRVGAQFRLFQTGSGVDVVRALHLDLTGRPVPAGRQVDGRGFQVENLDIPALVAYRRHGGRRPAGLPSAGTERAWLAADDPLPAVSAAVRSLAPAVAMAARRITR